MVLMVEWILWNLQFGSKPIKKGGLLVVEAVR